MLLNLRHDHGDRGHGRDVHERGHDVHARAYDHGRVHVRDRVYVRVCAHAHVYDRDRHLHGNARGELYFIKVQHPQDRQW